MRFIFRISDVFESLLSVGGCFYMMVIKENKPEDIERTMQGYGFRSDGVCLGLVGDY